MCDTIPHTFKAELALDGDSISVIPVEQVQLEFSQFFFIVKVF